MRDCFIFMETIWVMRQLVLHFKDLLRKIMPSFLQAEKKNKIGGIRKMVVGTHDVPKQIHICKQE